MTLPPDVSTFVKRSHAIIAWAIAGLAIALGFGVQTPNAKFLQLQAQVLANRDTLSRRIDTLNRDRWQLLRMMQFSTRYICTQLSPADQYRLGGIDMCNAAAHTEMGP